TETDRLHVLYRSYNPTFIPSTAQISDENKSNFNFNNNPFYLISNVVRSGCCQPTKYIRFQKVKRNRHNIGVSRHIDQYLHLNDRLSATTGYWRPECLSSPESEYRKHRV
ncbi:unnamed protein product, partial [Trichobilharzia regenti]